MKKTIKLTESDLTALVKKILNEVAEEPWIDTIKCDKEEYYKKLFKIKSKN